MYRSHPPRLWMQLTFFLPHTQATPSGTLYCRSMVSAFLPHNQDSILWDSSQPFSASHTGNTLSDSLLLNAVSSLLPHIHFIPKGLTFVENVWLISFHRPHIKNSAAVWSTLFCLKYSNMCSTTFCLTQVDSRSTGTLCADWSVWSEWRSCMHQSTWVLLWCWESNILATQLCLKLTVHKA